MSRYLFCKKSCQTINSIANTAFGKDHRKEVTRFYKRLSNVLENVPINSEISAFLKKTSLEIEIIPPTTVHRRYSDGTTILEIIMPTKENNQHREEEYLQGFYFTSQNRILVRADYQSDNDLQATLLNELHHAINAARNCQILKTTIVDMNDLSMPFLDANGQVCKEQMKKLASAHAEFKTNFEKFKKLVELQLKRKVPSKDYASFISDCATIMTHYQPILHKIKMQPIIFDESFNLGTITHYADGSMRIPARLVKNYKYDLHLFPTAEERYLFTYEFPDDPATKIYAFICDVERMTELYQPKVGSTYSQLDEKKQLLEYASHLDAIHPSIKALFAPQWCEYFSNLHDVDDYCDYSP